MTTIPTEVFIFNDICRFCCCRADAVYPIFQQSGENLGMIIKNVLPKLNVLENDLKPQQICFDCRSKLRMFSDFLQLCLDSDLKYSSSLKENSNKNCEDVIVIINDKNLTTQKIPLWSELKEVPTDLDKSRRIIENEIATLHADNSSCINSQSINSEVESELLNLPISIEVLNGDAIQNKVPDDKSNDKVELLLKDLSKEDRLVNLELDETFDYIVNDGLDSISQNTPLEVTVSRNDFTDGDKVIYDLDNNRSDLLNIWTEETTVINEAETVTPKKKSSGQRKYKPVSCKICGREFKKRTRLNGHMSQHTGIRSHRCSVCDKTYPMKHDLNKHMRIHARTYTCEICERPFTSQTVLNRHSMVHSGIKPVQCEICGKLLSSKQYLMLHKKSHSSLNGNKTYVCISCPTSFKDTWSLREHYDKVHSANPPDKLQCTICNKKFAWRTNYNRHIRRHKIELGISP